MSPTLYTFGGSVWSCSSRARHATPSPQKPSTSSMAKILILLLSTINPNATLPTLTAGGKTYKSTTDVISYLVAHAPKPLSTPPSHKAIIEKSERVAKAAALPKTFVENRQSALLKHSQDPANSRHASFYSAKLAGNGALLDIYTGANKDPAAFYAQHISTLSSLQSVPASGFIAGATPGEADFHVAAWLTRIAATSGATGAADAGRVVGKELLAPPFQSL
ncbi:hypothetical protein IW261DRAFT_1607150 [Armillaria novae-zelandiae]|uniref:GST N-terminal domain-containing protein n=1 Tax=Armillaria novae-zelandiae TaxID=153914 RepID=A0AA39UGT2_9AGAR|nr:hypothetical protein IW261DRAFT_1607150 [Armillaria novae-zelandiae]